MLTFGRVLWFEWFQFSYLTLSVSKGDFACIKTFNINRVFFRKSVCKLTRSKATDPKGRGHDVTSINLAHVIGILDGYLVVTPLGLVHVTVIVDAYCELNAIDSEYKMPPPTGLFTIYGRLPVRCNLMTDHLHGANGCYANGNTRWPPTAVSTNMNDRPKVSGGY